MFAYSWTNLWMITGTNGKLYALAFEISFSRSQNKLVKYMCFRAFCLFIGKKTIIFFEWTEQSNKWLQLVQPTNGRSDWNRNIGTKRVKCLVTIVLSYGYILALVICQNYAQYKRLTAISVFWFRIFTVEQSLKHFWIAWVVV